MATTKRMYVFATFWLSCAATALLVAAFATASWVNADLQSPDGTGFTGDMTCGLFTGTFIRSTGDSSTGALSQIYMTCVVEQNACAWSCQDTVELRVEEVRLLLQNGSASLNACPVTTVAYNARSPDQLAATSTRAGENAQFINMGLWVSTVLFLSLGLLLSVVCSVFGLLNTASNPIVPILGVQGLFIWNGAAASADLMTMTLWGTQFAVTLVDNVAYTETINGSYTSQGRADLGYSYWLVLVAMFVSIANIAILGFREYLLRIEPPPPKLNPEDQNTDGALFLY